MSEDNALVSGFRGMYTVRYERFTSRNIDEFNRILLAIEQGDKYKSVNNLYEGIEEHINNSLPHPIKLDKDEILSVFYDMYLSLGNEGTIADMVDRIDKKLSIATPSELAAGLSYTKTVSVNVLKEYWKTHLTKLSAHMPIRDTISHNACVNVMPIFFFDIQNWNTELSYSLENMWNTDGMTIVFKCGTTLGELFHIEFKNHILTFNVNSDNVNVMFDGYQLTQIDNTLLDIDTYVFSYSPKKVVLRNATQRDEVETVVYADNELPGYIGREWVLPSSPKFLVFNDNIGSANSNLREFGMYNFQVKKNEELFFIN